MWYRNKYIAGTMLVITGIMLLAGPASSQESVNIDDLLFQRLTLNEKAGIVSALNLGTNGEDLKGIEFKGTLTEQSRTITETRTDTNPTPEIVQSLTGRNCGNYEDTVHLTVTALKQHEETRHSEHHLNLSASAAYTMKMVAAEAEFKIGLEYGYAWGGSRSDITTTGWDQSVDVVVPPHQALEVNFMAFKQTVDADYERTFVATGEAVAHTTPVFPVEVLVRCFDGSQLTYGGSATVPYVGEGCHSSLGFVDPLRGIANVTITGPTGIVVEMFKGKDYMGDRTGLIESGRFSGDLLGVSEIVNSGFVFTEWSLEQIQDRLSSNYSDYYGALQENIAEIEQSPQPSEIEAAQHAIWVAKQDSDLDNWSGFEQTNTNLMADYAEKTRTYSLESAPRFYTKSLRIIDRNKPHACLYDEEGLTGARRCFNVDQDLDFDKEGVSRNFDNQTESIRVEGVRATLYAEPDFSTASGSAYQSFETDSNSLPETLANRVSGIKIEKIAGESSGENTFLIETFLDADRRTITETGTYQAIDHIHGYFERGISTRLSRSACCDSQTGTTSVDCTDEAWASTMTGFVVYVKPKPGTDGSGVIRQNGILCGEACTISAPLPDLPVLWKVEAVPDEGSIFSGWETESGQKIFGKHKPLPGDTVYAVFESAPTATEPNQDETTTP